MNAKLQNEFDQLDTKLIYLNHAAVAPWPLRTQQAVIQFASENLHSGAYHYPDWMNTEQNLRQQLATLINAPKCDDIALLKNTSEALSVVAYGLDWKPGDNVIISNEEFPSNRIVWESLASKGVEVKQVDLHSGSSPEQALTQAFDSRTRILSISSVQYASGLRVNLDELGQQCQQAGILFCVDAIQSTGALQIDVQAIQADFLMADGHKWMLGPEGLALFYCSSSARDQLQLQQFGWHMVEDYLDFNKRDWDIATSSRRFECGSPNMLTIHALSASISLLLEFGMDNIELQVLKNAEYLHQCIKQSPKLELLSNDDIGRYAGIVLFRHRKISSELLYQSLMKQGIVCAARGDGVRFSPHFYTTNDQISRAVEAAESMN
ncbi:MAG: aminotransferase class V-fold PLP-dependent enzyme [Gammaproteobacteria bacterium]|nr:aminotransferase class V-fold PLP-dependent enzyme [Gammaproteobacteria bacterium]